MRRRKRWTLTNPSVLVGLAGHAAMGAAVGLALSMALIFVDAFGVKALIAHSADPRSTTLTLTGALTLAFAVGATLTGLVLTMLERSKNKHPTDQ